jgi:hypothetical protein
MVFLVCSLYPVERGGAVVECLPHDQEVVGSPLSFSTGRAHVSAL